MNEERFNELALKFLAGEGSSEENAQLFQALQSSPALQRDFKELRASWEVVSHVAPLAGALDKSPSEVPVGIGRILEQELQRRFAHEELRSSSRESTGSGWIKSLRTQWARLTLSKGLITIGLALMLIVGWVEFGAVHFTGRKFSAEPTLAYLVVQNGQARVYRLGEWVPALLSISLRASDKVQLSSGSQICVIANSGQWQLAGPDEFTLKDLLTKSGSAGRVQDTVPQSSKLLAALFIPQTTVIDSGLLSVDRDRRPIHLYTPLDSTTALAPVIRWKADPGKTYDLALWDQFGDRAQLIALSGVTSPIDLAKGQGTRLAPAGLYRIVLREHGFPFSASEYTFRTVDELPGIPRASSPAEQLLQAYKLLTCEPVRTGDALQSLSELPAEWSNSELALRLQLYIFGAKGYREDFDRMAAKLSQK